MRGASDGERCGGSARAAAAQRGPTRTSGGASSSRCAPLSLFLSLTSASPSSRPSDAHSNPICSALHLRLARLHLRPVLPHLVLLALAPPRLDRRRPHPLPVRLSALFLRLPPSSSPPALTPPLDFAPELPPPLEPESSERPHAPQGRRNGVVAVSEPTSAHPRARARVAPPGRRAEGGEPHAEPPGCAAASRCSSTSPHRRRAPERRSRPSRSAARTPRTARMEASTARATRRSEGEGAGGPVVPGGGRCVRGQGRGGAGGLEADVEGCRRVWKGGRSSLSRGRARR